MIVMQFWLNLCYCSVAATSPILRTEPFAGNALLLISIDHPHVAGSVHDDDDIYIMMKCLSVCHEK